MNNDKWNKFIETAERDGETSPYVSRILFGGFGIIWLASIDEITTHTALPPAILLGIAFFAPKRFHLFVMFIAQFMRTFGS